MIYGDNNDDQLLINKNNGLVLSNNNSAGKYYSLNNQPDTSNNNLYLVNSEHKGTQENQKIVDNQVFNILSSAQKRLILEKLDNLEFSLFHLFLVFCLGTTWLFDGYEITLLSIQAIEIKEYFDINELQIGLINSFYLLGNIIGALYFGVQSYRHGRKRLFRYTLCIYIVSVILTSFSQNYYQFVLFRLLTGIAVGGEYTAIFAAIDEMIPKTNRGSVSIVIDGSWHLGSLMAALLSMFLEEYKGKHQHSIDQLNEKHLQFYQNEQWRILFLLGGLAGIPLIFMRSGIPESPRWLIYNNKLEKAQHIVDYIQQCCEKNIHMDASQLSQTISNTEYNLIETESQIQQKNNFVGILELMGIMVRQFRRRTILAISLMSSQAFFFQGVFYTFPIIVGEFYNVSKSEQAQTIFPISIASFMGPLLIGPLFDIIGRRKMILLSYCSTGLLIYLISYLFHHDNLPYQQLIQLWTLTFFLAAPGTGAAHLTVSEIFPSQFRSQSMAIFYSLGLLIGGVASPALFGYLIQQKQRAAIVKSYIVTASIMMFGGLIGFIYGINAENKSLEEITYSSEQPPID